MISRALRARMKDCSPHERLSSQQEIELEKLPSLPENPPGSMKLSIKKVGRESLLCYNYVISKKQTVENCICTYIGYIVKHPLDKVLTIRMTLKDAKSKEENNKEPIIRTPPIVGVPAFLSL